jgi:fatty-acid desaturase
MMIKRPQVNIQGRSQWSRRFSYLQEFYHAELTENIVVVVVIAAAITMGALYHRCEAHRCLISQREGVLEEY